MRQKSKKNLETEAWVDEYITQNGMPPTYQMIEKQFNLSRCAAWNRCAKFRHKMKQLSHLKTGQEKYTKIKLEFLIPNSKFDEFSFLLTKINGLLKTG